MRRCADYSGHPFERDFTAGLHADWVWSGRLQTLGLLQTRAGKYVPAGIYCKGPLRGVRMETERCRHG